MAQENYYDFWENKEYNAVINGIKSYWNKAGIEYIFTLDNNWVKLWKYYNKFYRGENFYLDNGQV